jgi:hypothetical protein
VLFQDKPISVVCLTMPLTQQEVKHPFCVRSLASSRHRHLQKGFGLPAFVIARASITLLVNFSDNGSGNSQTTGMVKPNLEKRTRRIRGT